MQIEGIKTRLFREHDFLQDFITGHVSSLKEGDILVVTSKIVALSEGRTGKIEDKKKLVMKESKKIIETPWALLTLMNDGWGINAGIDESNAYKKIILLPKNPFATAELIRKKLKKIYSLKNLGVLITDTRSIPLRQGTIGRTLGYAGFSPLKSYIGKKDLFGRKSRVTQSNVADALAAAAVIVMGEGSERIPLAIIKGAPVTFSSRPVSKKLMYLDFPPQNDIFAKIFTSFEHVSRQYVRKKAKRKRSL